MRKGTIVSKVYIFYVYYSSLSEVPFICYIGSSVGANSIVLTLVLIASGILDLMLDLN